MIKNLSMCIVSLLMACLLCAVAVPAMAMDQCDVVGNSYTITFGDDEYVLTDFIESEAKFSPAPLCGGKVYLMFPSGSFYFLDWSVSRDHNLFIAGLPAVLTEDGLTLYCIPEAPYTTDIGGVIYKTEREVPTLSFK